MNRALKLACEPEQRGPSRVCEIRHVANLEHEARCLLAWKRRIHPPWSQHAVSYRVTERKQFRRVK